MATRSSSRPGVAQAARQVSEHASAIARLEARLAMQEVQRKAKKLTGAAALLVAAGAFAWVGFLCAVGAGVAAIATALPVWAALLIGMGGLLVFGGALGLVGFILLKRGSPPIPEQAIQEARLTTEALKNGHS